ncbi:hypothetical protein E4T56_gene19164 [Termitomyces sp. T112]|nr:hypothetical protein E4T56_gene19164 [Termitomyces sp. T112]KAH0584306.1 hypothetical protein H2248_009851 [Termitomyces sp. 'cryptogamus']
MRVFAPVVFVLASLVFYTLARPHDSDTPFRKRHVRRSLATLSTSNVTLEDEGKVLQKRFGPTARFSFYKPGLGACGQTNGRNDFIVALNQEQFGNGENCFKTITITYGGKSTQATIVDECMECPYAALDFSPGLFDFFGPESAGYLYGSWEFGSGEPKTTSTPKPEPTTSTTQVRPTTTWTPEPTTSSTTTKKTSTSTSTQSSTTSSSVASSTTKASSSVTFSSSSTNAASSSVASSTAIPVPTDVLGQLDLVMTDLGAILVGGVLIEAGGQ